MSEKRSNSGLWKIEVEEGERTGARLSEIVRRYARLSRLEPEEHPPLQRIEMSQPFNGIELRLYLRKREGHGLYSFVGQYLASPRDRKKFHGTAVDSCLFIDTASNLFAVTGGFGYRVFEDYVDYGFPFDTAKRLVANNFRAADIRTLTGATTSRMETYRRAQSIRSSESFGKIWKRLVGRLNSALLPEDSYLRQIIDPNRPPTVEIKSSLVLRKSLDLSQLVSLAREIEGLEAPTPDQLRELSFLDNLYQVRSSSLREELKAQLIENLRQAARDDVEFDFDVCDPDDVARYYAGWDFKLGYWTLTGDPPDKDDLLEAIRLNLSQYVSDPAAFAEKIESVHLRYATGPDEDAPRVSKEMHKFLHGQVDHDGQTYFYLDKVWYRIQGDFLANLKKDFVNEVFFTNTPILLGPELPIIPWRDATEGEFNKRQAGREGFYFGDKIFAWSNRGNVELFDLLRVDEANGILYVIHVKDGFDAKMRDACSQISVAGDVIRQDLASDLSTLKSYYLDWQKNRINRRKRVSEADFVGWFAKLRLVYVVLVSTPGDFTPEAFESDRLHSHIARREVLATRNEFKSHDNEFRIAHTKRVLS
ncbi:DUF6119 family protein [Asanoa sp. NPDC049518]|uniref:DUF6119 family protein n=1 Tax=unclassified Asanoa TaxID=2685164 RepID=UPI00342B04CE